MINKRHSQFLFATLLAVLCTVVPMLAQGQPTLSCNELLGGHNTPTLQALEWALRDDTESTPVRLSTQDIARLVDHWTPELRPEFEVMVFESNHNKTVVALVAKKSQPSESLNFSDTVLGQQIVQWETLDIQPQDVSGMEPLTKDGRVFLTTNRQSFWGGTKTSRLKTKIFIAENINRQKISFNAIGEYLNKNPRLEYGVGKPFVSKLLRMLFGHVWIKILGRNGSLNSFDTSKALLNEQRVIVPGKKKLLHVVGGVFSAELIVDETSPFSGQLAPGRYFVWGRLSSSMKNLDIVNSQNQVEPNSLAMALLVFNSKDQEEAPGLLFVQDSLVPVQNPGLSSFQLTNNPRFSFKPTSVREFFEQTATVLGVALSSFMNSRDSARGVQGNYRSTLGAAGSGVDLSAGQSVAAPRFISMEFSGRLHPAQTHDASIKLEPNAQFNLRFSDNGLNWSQLGSLMHLNWLGLDSHELTFMHGRSGTIDAQTLRAASSDKGLGGLQLPIEIKPENEVNLE